MPESLTPNPMIKEGQLAGIIAIPLLGFLFGLIYIAKTFYITAQEFFTLMGCGFGMWIMMLIGIYALTYAQATKHLLFDREFGFNERLHPRLEIYCKPENIRALFKKGDKIERIDDLKERCKTLGFSEEIIKKIAKTDGFPKHLYYFKQRGAFEGWDNERHEVMQFSSHVVFQELPFREQYVFSVGQENWYGPMVFNHPHAESDNVKVLGWEIDPFTKEHMPVCMLIHSSKNYLKGKSEQEDLKLDEAQRMLIANQHRIIDTQNKALSKRQALLDGKFDDVGDTIKLGEEIANTDIDLYKTLLRPRRKGLLSGLWRVAKYAIMLFAIVLIVWIVLHYFFGVWMPLLG